MRLQHPVLDRRDASASTSVRNGNDHSVRKLTLMETGGGRVFALTFGASRHTERASVGFRAIWSELDIVDSCEEEGLAVPLGVTCAGHIGITWHWSARPYHYAFDMAKEVR
jgi:hypothetical protein